MPVSADRESNAMNERKRKQTIKQLLDDATTAHCDLNMFYAIIALAENSLISAEHEVATGRIIKICLGEAQKALARLDEASDAILKDPRP